MGKDTFNKISDGLNEAIEISKRRFGRNFDKPCARPSVLECALWECQSKDICQYAKDGEVVKINQRTE